MKWMWQRLSAAVQRIDVTCVLGIEHWEKETRWEVILMCFAFLKYIISCFDLNVIKLWWDLTQKCLFYVWFSVKYRLPLAFFATPSRLQQLIQGLEAIPSQLLETPEACNIYLLPTEVIDAAVVWMFSSAVPEIVSKDTNCQISRFEI